MSYINGVLLSSIEAQKTEFGWDKWIPYKYLTLLAADQNAGKSTLRDELIRRVTLGLCMPDGSENGFGAQGVILVSPEEDIQGVVYDRLVASGADISKVLLLNTVVRTVDGSNERQESKFQIPDDIALLESEIENSARHGLPIGLIVLDPVMAILNPRYAKSGNQLIRQLVIDPLQEVLARTGTCALVIAHFTKSRSPQWDVKLGGSKAWGDSARSVMLLSSDSDNPRRRILTCVKHSNTIEAPSQLTYEMDSDGRLVFLTGLTNERKAELVVEQKSKATSDVLALLASDSTKRFTSTEISQVTGISNVYVRGILKRLVDSEQIFLAERGKYTSLQAVTI